MRVSVFLVGDLDLYIQSFTALQLIGPGSRTLFINKGDGAICIPRRPGQRACLLVNFIKHITTDRAPVKARLDNLNGHAVIFGIWIGWLSLGRCRRVTGIILETDFRDGTVSLNAGHGDVVMARDAAMRLRGCV